MGGMSSSQYLSVELLLDFSDSVVSGGYWPFCKWECRSLVLLPMPWLSVHVNAKLYLQRLPHWAYLLLEYKSRIVVWLGGLYWHVINNMRATLLIS